MANAGEDASFDARAVAARNDAFFDGGAGASFSGSRISDWDSIQIEGESQSLQTRAMHLRTSKDFNCSSSR